jgi:hypothetical protein
MLQGSRGWRVDAHSHNTRERHTDNIRSDADSAAAPQLTDRPPRLRE